MKRFILFVGTVLAIASHVSAQAADTGLPSRKYLPLPLSIEAAEAAVAKCASMGFAVTATVVDRDGLTKVQLVSDDTRIIAVDGSRRKAATAARHKTTTASLGAAFKANPDAEKILSKVDPEIIESGGGIPITVGGDVIGGIGVGGAPPRPNVPDAAANDEECAQAGIDKIKDRLK